MGNYYAMAAMRSAARMEKLHELEGKADYLAKKTGSAPKNWYEFKSSVADSSVDTSGYSSIVSLALGFIGAVAGLTAGIAFPELLIPLVLGGALAGGGVGVLIPVSSEHILEKKIDKYDDYLKNFEISIQQGKAVGKNIEMGDYIKTSHAAELVAKRQESSQAISI